MNERTNEQHINEQMHSVHVVYLSLVSKRQLQDDFASRFQDVNTRNKSLWCFVILKYKSIKVRHCITTTKHYNCITAIITNITNIASIITTTAITKTCVNLSPHKMYSLLVYD